mgnify:CR=1 FL=1
MSEFTIRQARLDDTAAISALFRARIGVWQRLDSSGRVEDVPYEALTLYERWLHGGAWMSVETGAIHLSHLLRGAGLALVAESGGGVCAYCEGYTGSEPPPFGPHLHLTAPAVHPDAEGSDLDGMLVRAMADQARALRLPRLLASAAPPEHKALYAAQGMRPVAEIRRCALPARSGQGFYRAVDHPDPNPALIEGWHMPLGRLESARCQWETLWPRTWDALPEMRQRRIHRLRLNAAGHDALLCVQQQLYQPRSADVYCWSPRPLTSQLLTAVRDWAHREGYRTLVMAVTEDARKTLGPEAEPDAFTLDVYALDV